MILLDTHVWIWHVQKDKQLPKKYRELIEENERSGLAVSSISQWEVAKAVQVGHLRLPVDVEVWLSTAIDYPGIVLIELTPAIVVESTRLPGNFHRDPADQLIVATARVRDMPIVTVDNAILKYPHVKLLP